MNTNNKGFTLIELLVVIAIIGILSAVVLASLNTARSKGNDANIKSNLVAIRTQAAIYYDTNNGYSTGASSVVAATAGTVGACNTTANSLVNDTNVAGALAAADKASGGAGVIGATTKVVCATNGATAPSKTSLWAVAVPLVTDTTKSWCVDSAGNSRQITGCNTHRYSLPSFVNHSRTY